jgi:hypothetical protein
MSDMLTFSLVASRHHPSVYGIDDVGQLIAGTNCPYKPTLISETCANSLTVRFGREDWQVYHGDSLRSV